MANWLDYFFGGKPPPQIAPPPPTNAPYPSQADALHAIEQGYGYGSGNEPYINAQRAEIYDRRSPSDLSAAIGADTTNTDLTRFRNLADLNRVQTTHAQAALAANRNPIAALGYDPQKIGLQTSMAPTTVAGAYSPDQDRTWVNVNNPGSASTPVHESIHRGLEQLRQTSPEARELLKKLPHDEENIVRYIMATQMGDPEQGKGDVADKQRERALNMFKQQAYFFDEPMKRITELAAEARKNRRPGGPR
jgi:hypothetical protein